MLWTALRKLFGLEVRLDQRRQLRTRFRPQLEALEDRTLLSVTWQVQSDFFGVSGSISQPRSLRGLALSADNQNLYAGFIQGTTSAAIREVSSGVNSSLIGNDGGSPNNSYGSNPPYTTGLEAKVTTYNQSKGLATDDRGNIYATLNSPNNLTSQSWAIYSSDLTQQLAAKTSTSTSSQLSGIATAKLDGHYYVYVGWKNGQIERWNVDNATNPVLDTSWGNSGIISLKNINVNAYLNGLTVDTNGDIYVAGGLKNDGNSFGDSLIKITAAGAASGSLNSTNTSHVDVNGGANGLGGEAAMDVALFNGKAYVTEYLASNSTIAVFNMSDLSSDGILTPDNPTGPSGLNATFPTGVDSGFSDIDIGADGKIYVAEQLYNFVASTSSYTPPGGTPMTGIGIYFDRVLVSSTLGVAPAIASADNTTFTVGTLGSFTVTTTGIPTPSLSESGALPDNVTFVDNGDGTATLSGTPAAGSGGTYQFSIIAHNGIAPDATQLFTLTNNEAPSITSADHTTFTVGTLGSFTVTTGHSFPANATLTETGTLPSNVTFVDNGDGTATLSGTPVAGSGGVYHFTITASNGVSPDATQSFTLTNNEGLTITSADHTTFTVGTLGSFTVTTGHSFPNATLSESGTLPGGVTFVDNHDGTATLSGTPAADSSGVYHFTITASNSVSPDATQSFTLTVGSAIRLSPASLPAGTLGVFYNQTITASGGTGNKTLTYALAPGRSANGLVFIPSTNQLMILGLPTAKGTVHFTVTATDQAGAQTTQDYTIAINQRTITFSPATLPPATAGTPYNQTITASGGMGLMSVTYQVTSGSLPAGLRFSPGINGLTIGGTPKAAGTVTFSAIAKDSFGDTASQTYTLTVNPAASIALSPSTIPSGTTGAFYNQTITASGGVGNKIVTYQVLSGSLPAGLRFTTGVNGLTIGGTPRSAGTVTFRVTAKDQAGGTTTQDYTLTINPAAPITLRPGTIPTGTVGMFYNQTILASGGVGYKIVTYRVTSGSLPKGLSIIPGVNGLTIVGKPTTTGTVTFSVTARDLAGDILAQDYTLKVLPSSH